MKPSVYAVVFGVFTTVAALVFTPRALAASFTRLAPVPSLAITSASDSQSPAQNHVARNLLDGNPVTEFVSDAKATQTYVEFDFGAPTLIAAFRHQDRANHSTMSASELVLLDASGNELRRISIAHADRKSAVVFETIAPAVTASRARWQVTKLGASKSRYLGGAEIAFFTVTATDPTPSALSLKTAAPFIATRDSADGIVKQPIRVEINYPYSEPIDTLVRLGDAAPRPIRLKHGSQTIEFSIPTSASARQLPLTITRTSDSALQPFSFSALLQITPFREITVYVLQHSHVDIGYTEIQPAIEEKQINNLLIAMDAAEQTATYPEGSRFIWNLENLWPADLYFQRLAAPHRTRLLNALRSGQVAPNGMYFNILTGLCRPEELIRAFRYSTQLAAQTGITIDSAQISDVPGYTWGTVTALSQAGIKYLSPAPNNFDRIGTTMTTWDNKPFWWIGPDGHTRVLTWIPRDGYSFAHRRAQFNATLVEDFLNDLVSKNYPYDITYLRWSRGDNGPPDTLTNEHIRDWNATHAWPRFITASTSGAFSAFEKKYGSQLPEYRGDWTPYWEDGAGSSALETAQTRASSDRFAQAETLCAMFFTPDATYPVRDFADAMRSIHLYEEHTWGASRSVTAPDDKSTTEQWAIKSSYSATADAQTRALLSRSLALASAAGAVQSKCIDIFNTSSWPRSGLVTLSKELVGTEKNLRVLDDTGAPVPSQRLSTGELVIWAGTIPPFASRRYTITEGAAHAPAAPVTITKNTLDNGIIKILIDEKTGDITELRSTSTPDSTHNFADTTGNTTLNTYLYFTGSDSTKTQTSGPVTIRIKERGPLIATLAIESSAPGCHRLTREVTLIANCDYAQLANVVDKQRIPGKNYRDTASKESVNFAFPFNVADGQVRIETPFAITRPDIDQIPGSCKNWFTVNRWADVSNQRHGITLVPLDAPLLQLGGLTANLLNSQTNPAVWRTEVGPTQKLYSWVMNNHWGTNYRAYQEGPVTFRYVLRPHAQYDSAAATRLAIDASQPLLPARAFGKTPASTPRLTLDTTDIVVLSMKPSDDNRALILRLWNASAHPAATTLRWSAPEPRSISVSDTSEQPQRELPATAPIELAPQSLLTLRAEL